MAKEKRTTIRVTESLKKELDDLKLIPDETYMSVIRRLIETEKKAHKYPKGGYYPKPSKR